MAEEMQAKCFGGEDELIQGMGEQIFSVANNLVVFHYSSHPLIKLIKLLYVYFLHDIMCIFYIITMCK